MFHQTTGYRRAEVTGMKNSTLSGHHVTASFSVLLLIAIMTLAAGCNAGDSEDVGPTQIFPSGTDYTIDFLKGFGVKMSRQYDVEDLPNSLDAWKVLWGSDPNNKHDYEVRFYPSHDLAISSGKSFAKEATASEIELSDVESERKDEFLSHQSWKEGASDRWRGRRLPTFTGSVVNATGPMYLNWIIVGNIVIICDGIDDQEALSRCNEMKTALLGQ